MNKKFFLSLAFVIFSMAAFGQSNAIKLNLTNLLTPFPRTASVAYERVIADNISVNTTIGILVPVVDGNALATDDGGFVGNTRLGGLNITPEVRFYTGRNGAPRGFYVAPYLRYNTWSAKLDGTFTEAETGNNTSIDGELVGRINFVGLGVQFGAQWVISDVFVIDWYFLGLSANFTNIAASFTPDAGTFDIDEVRAALETYSSDFPLINEEALELLEEGERVKATSPGFLLPGFRTGFNIGYAF